MRTPLALLAVFGVTTLVSGCSTPQAAEPKAARPVRTHTVAEAAGQPAIRYSASIEAFEQVPLAFKANGYITDVMRRKGADGRARAAQPGDLVTRGAVLARVHEADYQERVNQGRARLAEAEAVGHEGTPRSRPRPDAVRIRESDEARFRWRARQFRRRVGSGDRRARRDRARGERSSRYAHSFRRPPASSSSGASKSARSPVQAPWAS